MQFARSLRVGAQEKGVPRAIILATGILFILILLVFVGFRSFLSSKKKVLREESERYAAWMNRKGAVKAEEAELPRSGIYKTFAHMRLAYDSVQGKGEFLEAKEQLFLALTSTNDPQLIAIINLRIARIEAALVENKEALDRLSTIKLVPFSSWGESIKGDIFAQMGKKNAARESYKAALSGDHPAILSDRINMKLDDLLELKGSE